MLITRRGYIRWRRDQEGLRHTHPCTLWQLRNSWPNDDSLFLVQLDHRLENKFGQPILHKRALLAERNNTKERQYTK